MKKIKFVFKYMHPEVHKLLLIILCVMLYSFGLLLAPLMVTFVLDHIINGLETNNVLMQFILSIFGGRELLLDHLWIASLCIVLIYIVVAFGVYKKGVYSGIISETFTRNIRNSLYDHLQKLPFAYHKVKDSGDLIQRSTSDIDQIRRFLATQIVEMLYAIFTTCFAITILLMLNVQLTLISFAIFPVLVLSSFLFFRKTKRLFLECDHAESKLTTTLQENLNAVRVVKAFNKEIDEIDKFENVNTLYRDKLYELMRAIGIFWSSTDLLCLLQTFVMILFGIKMAYEQVLSAGEFFLFLTYVSLVIYPLRQLGRIIADMGKLSVAIDRIDEILQEENEDLEKGLKPMIKGNIRFEDVSFQYDDGNQHTLKHINLEIKQNQSVAIMGATGSGKSSLVNLLTRLYEYQGSIKIDGIELNEIAKTWIRKNVSIVLQEPFLFSKTIYDNIALAKNDAHSNDVIKAAKIAYIHDVIEGFDEGYETEVGEKGVTLSGGQKQRIAIARTIINDAPIIIFDDSLSALDSKTDRLIQEELAKLNANADITMMIITHRINSAKNADLIIVLEEGRIVQQGTHETLSKQEGIYKTINEIQNGGGVKDE